MRNSTTRIHLDGIRLNHNLAGGPAISLDIVWNSGSLPTQQLIWCSYAGPWFRLEVLPGSNGPWKMETSSI